MSRGRLADGARSQGYDGTTPARDIQPDYRTIAGVVDWTCAGCRARLANILRQRAAVEHRPDTWEARRSYWAALRPTVLEALQSTIAAVRQSLSASPRS